MAKSTTIFTLFQKFISQVEIDGILAEGGFEDTARKCDVSKLLITWLALLHLNGKAYVTLPMWRQKKA